MQGPRKHVSYAKSQPWAKLPRLLFLIPNCNVVPRLCLFLTQSLLEKIGYSGASKEDILESSKGLSQVVKK